MKIMRYDPSQPIHARYVVDYKSDQKRAAGEALTVK